MRRALVLCAALCLPACAGAAPIDFHVYVPPGQMPLRGADRVVVWRTEAGVLVRDSRRTQAVDERAIDLGQVPFGAQLAVVIEARLGDVPLARGRSFPFDYLGPDLPPSVPADVTLLRVGQSAALAADPPGAPIAAITRTDRGALLALTDGRVLAFDAHGAADGAPTSYLVASLPQRAGARWVAFGDALLGVGGASAGASLVARGGLLEELPASDAVPLETPALIAGSVTEREALVVLADARALMDVTWDGERLGFAPREPLMAALGEARAVRVETRSGGRVLLVESARVTLVDPRGSAAPHALDLPTELAGRAAAALETGLVVLAGGRDPSSGVPSAEVSLLVVRPERAPELELLAPAPQPLFSARSDAALVTYASGLALVSGGRAAGGEPSSDTELLDVRLDRLPGEIVVTGPLPVAMERPLGIALSDGSVLFADEVALALHAPAR